jgi:hypothetical protein
MVGLPGYPTEPAHIQGRLTCDGEMAGEVGGGERKNYMTDTSRHYTWNQVENVVEVHAFFQPL